MAVFAHFDSEGSIRALVNVNAPPGMSIMLTPKPGSFVAEVEGLKLKSQGFAGLEELHEIAQTHKISSPVPRCKLTKKAD
jgi:hypothetical protein